MAINFPSGPVDGQLYTEGGVTWKWVAAKTSWVLNISGTIASHTHSWADITSGKPTTIGGYGITDFNSLGDARWSLLGHTHTFASLTSKPTTIGGYGITDFNSLGDARWAPLGSSGIPTGTILPYAGLTEPANFLFCYGQAASRITYAALFNVIGTTYGAGDGSTTFNLPDLRGRVVAGQDDMGGVSANRLTNLSGGVDGDVLGAAGGAEIHTLTIAQMPAHNHTYVSDSSAATSGGGTNSAEGTTSTTGSTGGNAAHNNVQPTIILNYMIRI